MSEHAHKKFLFGIATVFFILSGILAIFVQTQVAYAQNERTIGGTPSQNRVCDDVETGKVEQQEWSRFIKISVPIPNVTSELLCYDSADTLKTTVIDSYYYTTDLGTYLAGLYQFFVGIVGILASVMILYAGIRWVLAAGNQSRIQASKNIIFSAIIGIVIAFTSYLLLYLLNPKLVNYENLALPNIVDTEQITGSCLGHGVTQVAAKKISAACFDDVETCNYEVDAISYVEDPETRQNLPVVDADRLACGDTGIIQDPQAYGQKCIGVFCWDQALCVSEKQKCIQGKLVGLIEYVGNAYVDDMRIEGVCNDGTRIANKDNKYGALHFNADSSYTFYTSNNVDLLGLVDNFVIGQDAQLQDIAGECSSHSGFAGYFLNIEINDDQQSLFGIVGPTCDDRFALDKNCRVINKSKDPFEYTPEEWKAAIAQRRLFQTEDLTGGTPRRCDINIYRSSFPARSGGCTDK